MPPGEIVGHGILVVVNIGHPIIGIDVGKVEKIEDIEPYPNTLEGPEKRALHDAVFPSGQTARKSDVDTTIGRPWEGRRTKWL